jgi:hypothetical protein
MLFSGSSNLETVQDFHGEANAVSRKFFGKTAETTKTGGDWAHPLPMRTTVV